MRKFTTIILVALAVSMVFLSGRSGNIDATRDKARYYFLEAARESAAGNPAEAYEYYKKAYSLDSSYSDAAFSYGSQRLLIRTPYLQSDPEIQKSLSMLRKYVDDAPKDVFAGRFYGYVASRLDTVAEAIRVYERMTELMPSETYMLLNLTDAYMMNREIPKALETLKKYESVEGKSEEISYKKISIYLSEGDTVEAVNEATELIESNPRNPNYYILKGNLMSVIEQQDSALVYYLKSEALSPDNGSVKMALANYYAETGDSVAYDEKIYEALLSEDFYLEDKLGILSNYLQTLINDKGETSRGDYLFSVLLEQYPHEPEVIDLSARYSGAKGDFKEAASQISYAIDLDPNNETYWLQLMRYQIAGSEPGKVVETYKKAREYFDADEPMSFMYVTALNELNDYESAEKVYSELVNQILPGTDVNQKIENNDIRKNLNLEELIKLSTYYNMLGDMFYQAKNLEKAYSSYDNSLFFFPSNALTLNNYAYFLAENGGDLDKAQEMSRKAIAEDDKNPTYLDTYAWILFKKKDYKEAKQYQEMAIEKAESVGDLNSEYYHHYGDILFMNHEPEKALENWKRLLNLSPTMIC